MSGRQRPTTQMTGAGQASPGRKADESAALVDIILGLTPDVSQLRLLVSAVGALAEAEQAIQRARKFLTGLTKYHNERRTG